MGFDAGSIFSKAELDRTPFQEGLRLAIQEGEDFERRRFTATVGVRTEARDFDALERRLREISSRSYTTKLDVDVTGASRLDAMIRRLEDFARKTWTAKVDLDTGLANAKLDALKIRLAGLDTTVTVRVRYRPDPLPPVPVPPGGGPDSPGSGAGSGLPGGLLPFAILSALPLIGPLAGAATGALLGTAGAVGTLTVGFLGLKREVEDGTKSGREMQAQLGSLQTHLKDLEQTGANAIRFGVMASLRQARAELPGFNDDVAEIGVRLGDALGKTTSAVFSVLDRSKPLFIQVADGLNHMADSAVRFAQSEKFSQFLAYAQKEGPVVVTTIGHLVQATVDLSVALAPAGDKMLRFIDTMARGADEAARLASQVDRLLHLSGGGGSDGFGDRLMDNLGGIPGKILNPVGNLYGMLPHGGKKPSTPSQDDVQTQQIYATKAAVAQLVDTEKSAGDVVSDLGKRYGLSDTAIKGYAASLGIADGALKNGFGNVLAYGSAQDRAALALQNGGISARAYTADVAVMAEANRKGTASTMEFLAAVDAFSKSEGTAADRAGLISAALKQANGDLLGYAAGQVQAATANQALVDSMNKQTRATINLKTGTIDYRNAAAGPLLANLQALQDAAAKAAGATYQHEQATKGATKASDDAVKQYYAQTHDALISEASQLGLTKAQAKLLADEYLSLPKDITTRIKAIGTDPMLTVLNQIGKQLSFLTGKPWVPTVAANITPAQKKMAELDAIFRATHGSKTVVVRADVANAVRTISRFISDPATKVVQVVTTGGPSGPFGGRQITSAYGNIVKSYGFGGVDDQPNNHQPAIYPVRPDRTYRVFAEPETQGEVYAPLANDHRRPRAKAIIAEAARMMGGYAEFADGGFGFTNVLGPSSSGSGSSTSTAASRAAANANRAIAASLDTTLFRQLQQLDTLATGTAAHVQAATTTIVTAFRKAFSTGFTDSAMVRSINAETAALNKAVAQRDVVHSKLLAANKVVADTRAQMADVRATVAGNIVSRFDIGTSGNGYQAGILATLTQDRDDARKFAQLRGQAEKLGLDKRLVRQLTAEGPQVAGRNLEAIVAGGKSYVAQLNTLYGQFDSAAQATGQAQAQADLGAQLAAQSRTATKLTQEQTAEQRKINRTLAEIRSDLVALDRKLEAARRGR